jgi:NADPH:quinone reductase-like Zn-dependent oxidoreductase
VEAISVNPVDVKVRASAAPEGTPYKILGWDAAGVVTEVGSESGLFKIGDEVYYAGSLKRPGTNAEFQLVDERIVDKKPKSLDFAAAAALPGFTPFRRLFHSEGRSMEVSSDQIVPFVWRVPSRYMKGYSRSQRAPAVMLIGRQFGAFLRTQIGFE